VLGVVLVVFPWTLRNYATYRSVILIDTTGAENLWLDNDPAGREAVKAQLYAYGDDRAGRQRLAMQNGVEAILSHPHHVLRKAWEEGTAFFALEYTDDMRDRPAIWVPPAEVWSRLLLGDGLFLVVLLGGVAGLWPARWGEGNRGGAWLRAATDPRWLMGAWVLYLFLTAMLFHVELRYRLPLYPALLPYAAITLARVGWWGTRLLRGERSGLRSLSRLMVSRHIRGMMVRLLVLLLHPAMLVLYATLLHAPYPSLAWSLGQKHVHLARAAHALGEGNPDAARTAAHAALEQDARSVLARVALARAELLCGDRAGAERILREAIDMLPAHPYPHLLLGDLLRQRGDDASARHELAYETASLQDLQAWSWQRMSTPPPSRLDVGGGLDLGMIGGVHARRAGTHWRWTTDHARLRLVVPMDASSPLVLRLRLASGRPEGAPPPLLRVLVNGQTAGEFLVSPGWNIYAVALPRSLSAGEGDTLIVELRSDTFAPRDYDPASSDGRTLGVMVDWAAVGELEE
jgi:tetratricopeptide (TPR) repeat protein